MRSPVRRIHFLLLAVSLQLAGCSPLPEEVRSYRAPVFLNHFYAVLDAETYEAIGSSDFLRAEFAAFEQRSTLTGDGESWTATYFYGRETYFEFFEASAADPAGIAGIGLGVDAPGDLESVRKRLADEGFPVVSGGPVTRVREEERIPWFHWVGFEDGPEDPAFSVWIMQYHEDYLRLWNPGLPPEEDGITREHHRAIEFEPSRYLRDVVGLTLALTPRQSERLLGTLSALGYETAVAAGVSTARGPGIEFRIVDARPGVRGVTEIRMSLQRPKTGETTFQFGHSILTFDSDSFATWRFSAPAR